MIDINYAMTPPNTDYELDISILDYELDISILVS